MAGIDFGTIRTLYKKKLIGFFLRIGRFYIEVGMARKLEPTPLSEEEKRMAKDLDDEV